MVLFMFSVLEQKHPFWANLVQKIKSVSLSSNLVPGLIQICRIQWWCSLFCFVLETFFLVYEGKQSRIIVPAISQELNFEIGRCCQLVVSTSVDCFCALNKLFLSHTSIFCFKN